MPARLLMLSLFPMLVVTAAPSARPPAVPSNTKHTAPARILVIDGSPVHDAGELLLHTGNWGGVGSAPAAAFPFSGAPSAQWPAGSGVEYLYLGGLWVGGIVGGVPAVSTAAFEFEFRPTDDPIDIVYRSVENAGGGARLPSPMADDDADGRIDEDPLDGRDNDDDGAVDEDFAGISDQMFSRWYTDDQPAASQIYPGHHPLPIRVYEYSYQWADDEFDDFVGFDYVIENTGDATIEDVFVGWFIDGDAGPRTQADYWEDDATDFARVTGAVTPHGAVDFDFAFVYDMDGDGGRTTANFGVVVLDHPTDPTGVTAPVTVGASTYAWFSGSAPWGTGGDPTNDFERYESMSSQTIARPAAIPRDVRFLVSAGPFAELAPGQKIRVSMALVATPRDGNFENVARAVVAHRGEFFDVDGDPGTGEDGREYQAHWWLPGRVPVVEVQVRLTPPTINLRSGGPLTAHIIFPAGMADAVDGSSLRLNRTIPGRIVSRAGANGVVVEFPRREVSETIAPGFHRMEVSGRARGIVFRGSDTVRVIGRPRAPATEETTTITSASASPNPFNPATRITIELSRASAVTLEVYAADGRRVARLLSQPMPAGRHAVTWSGIDARGNQVPSGIYFYRLFAGGETLTRKMILLR